MEIVIRGTRTRKVGRCTVCEGVVVERVSPNPVGQVVTPATYVCSECGVTGSSLLWADAWASARMATFTPTSENINALPGRLRDYIHDLEALADPAGIVAELALLRDQNAHLQKRIEEISD